jgi:hypothetical protein
MTLEEIKTEIDRRAKVIGATEYLLPTYGHTEDFARPHIEIDQRGYHYVVVERGQEWERFTTKEVDELLYRVFRSVTFNLACDYELKHRVERQDSRRINFQHGIELLSRLSPRWADRCSQELEEILKKHPFDDSPT